MPETPRVLVFEPGEGGHRLQYIRSMLPAIEPLAEVVIALRQDIPASEDYRVILGDLARYGARVKVDASVPVGHPWRFSTQWSRVGALRRIARAHRVNRIYIPSADGLAQIMGLSRLIGRRGIPRRVPCEALVLRGRFAYRDISGLKEAARVHATWKLGVLAPFDIMHLLDPIVYERVMRDDPTASRRFRLMPEPVEPPALLDKRQARRLFGIPEDGRYVGCAGFIDLRKGIDLMLRAFREGLGDSPTDRLLLAGPQGPQIPELLSGEFAPLVRSGRVISIDRLFNSQEVGDVLGAMDLVVTPYRKHVGSASILIRAAAAGRPVLSADFGWMGMVTRRFGLGETVDVFDAPAFARAMRKALDASESFELSEGARRFTQFHTIENFATHWSVELRRELGLGAPEKLKTWDWVLDATGQNVALPDST